MLRRKIRIFILLKVHVAKFSFQKWSMLDRLFCYRISHLRRMCTSLIFFSETLGSISPWVSRYDIQEHRRSVITSKYTCCLCSFRLVNFLCNANFQIQLVVRAVTRVCVDMRVNTVIPAVPGECATMVHAKSKIVSSCRLC